tara:strand:+ start:793 stop:1032 length:240 start_codon:yes stop_codon:yes gene_type:complete
MKIQINHIVSVVILGILSWGSMTLFTMNAQMALVVYKVDQNHKMIQPIWRDFLQRQISYGNIQGSNEQTDIHASIKEKR